MRKNDIEKYYDIEPLMDKKCFIEMLILTLANNSKIYKVLPHGNTRMTIESDEKEATLPFTFKEEIADELNRNAMNYSKVLDISQFFDNQILFERELNEALEYYLNVKRYHNYSINFEREAIEVPFVRIQVDAALANFDEDLIEIVNDMASVISLSVGKRERTLMQKESDKELKKLQNYNDEKINKIMNRSIVDIVREEYVKQKTKRRS